MIDLAKIIIYLLEGLAVTGAIYLITKKSLQMTELITLAVTVSVTFMVLDMFAPAVSAGARQGAGFGLGFRQVGAGNGLEQGGGGPSPFPLNYFDREDASQAQEGGSLGGCAGCMIGGGDGDLEEGMDDRVAIEYYQRYNPPYHKNNLPPPLNTKGIYQGAPRTLEYDQVAAHQGQVPQPMGAPIYNSEEVEEEDQEARKIAPPQGEGPSGSPGVDKVETFASCGGRVEEYFAGSEEKAKVPSEIAKKIRENPFDTSVRSRTEIDLPGAYYDQPDIQEAIPSGVYPDPMLYNPLKPTYGFRYKLPRGWDQLEQENLHIAMNRFRNNAEGNTECQGGPYGEDGRYNPNFRFQKKNV
jgi:hypothetical protein